MCPSKRKPSRRANCLVVMAVQGYRAGQGTVLDADRREQSLRQARPDVRSIRQGRHRPPKSRRSNCRYPISVIHLARAR
jgi:hypothetical protein